MHKVLSTHPSWRAYDLANSTYTIKYLRHIQWVPYLIVLLQYMQLDWTMPDWLLDWLDLVAISPQDFFLSQSCSAQRVQQYFNKWAILNQPLVPLTQTTHTAMYKLWTRLTKWKLITSLYNTLTSSQWSKLYFFLPIDNSTSFMSRCCSELLMNDSVIVRLAASSTAAGDTFISEDVLLYLLLATRVTSARTKRFAHIE